MEFFKKKRIFQFLSGCVMLAASMAICVQKPVLPTRMRVETKKQNIKAEPEAVNLLLEIKEYLNRVEKKQKESSLQLDDISEMLGGDTGVYIDALIETADVIEDFYRYAVESSEVSLYTQAKMMWDSAKSTLENAGLEVIDDKGAVFDFKYHTAKGTSSVLGVPDGCILKIIKSGYVKNGDIIRQASVIVNKVGLNNESWN